ncbi:hypothetical protein NL676_027827 [Syzygium grande]|nr:hypothetical protein NL676_027827 [Syzygium grande]
MTSIPTKHTPRTLSKQSSTPQPRVKQERETHNKPNQPQQFKLTVRAREATESLAKSFAGHTIGLRTMFEPSASRLRLCRPESGPQRANCSIYTSSCDGFTAEMRRLHGGEILLTCLLGY